MNSVSLSSALSKVIAGGWASWNVYACWTPLLVVRMVGGVVTWGVCSEDGGRGGHLGCV